MKSKSNKQNKLDAIEKAFEKRLLQEVLVIQIKNQEGRFSHSEISYFCLN